MTNHSIVKDFGNIDQISRIENSKLNFLKQNSFEFNKNESNQFLNHLLSRVKAKKLVLRDISELT